MRDPPPAKDAKAAKIDVLPQSSQMPAPTTLVVGTDGLSNLIQAAGIQIISESDAARLQPVSIAHPSFLKFS